MLTTNLQSSEIKMVSIKKCNFISSVGIIDCLMSNIRAIEMASSKLRQIPIKLDKARDAKLFSIVIALFCDLKWNLKLLPYSSLTNFDCFLFSWVFFTVSFILFSCSHLFWRIFLCAPETNGVWVGWSAHNSHSVEQQQFGQSLWPKSAFKFHQQIVSILAWSIKVNAKRTFHFLLKLSTRRNWPKENWNIRYARR